MAFDFVSRDGLFKILPLIGFPSKLLSFIKSFHDGSRGTVQYVLKSTEEGIPLRTGSDGKLFNLARLRAKTKVRKAILRDFLFADDAALVAHSAEKLQGLLNQFSSACEAFRLTISLKNTKVTCQGNEATPALTIEDYTLAVVPQFTYLGSTTSNNACLDVELGKRIGKAATNMAKLVGASVGEQETNYPA